MASKLLLGQRELNPDVLFIDTSVWTIGVDWTVYLNSNAGAIATSATGSNLTLTDSPLRVSTAYKYKLYVKSCSGTGSATLSIGGNIITINASASPVVYEGLVTTASSDNTVSLLATSGVDCEITQLRICESPERTEIDLTDDIDVPITYSAADVKDISTKKNPYSKQVTIPATKVNNKYFKHIYEISGDGTFNPNKKVPAQVIEDGIELLNGVCQLKQINRKRVGLNNYTPESYEIVLLGKLTDFFYLIGDLLLSDLDFSEFNHIYDITNQRESWYTQIQKNGAPYVNSVNGGNLTITSCANNAGRLQLNFSGAHGLLAEDWILIPDNAITAGSEFYYGEHEVYEVVSSTSVIIRCPFDVAMGTTLTTTNTVHKHTKTGEGYVYPMVINGGVTGNTWKVGNFFPAIYLKQYIDKIFKKVGFTYDSSLFNSTMFKKIIVTFNSGVLQLTQELVDAKKFRASSSALVSGSYIISGSYNNSGNYAFPANYRGHAISGFGVGPGYTPFSNTAPATLDIPIDDDTTVPNFDNGSNFNTGTYRFVCPVTGQYDLNVNVLIEHNYVLPGGVTQANTTDTPPVGITAYKYNLNINQSTSPGYGGFPQMRLEIYDYTAAIPVTVGTNTINGFQSSATAVAISVLGASLIAGHQYGVRLVYNLPARGQFWTTQFTTPYSGDITVNYQVNANAVFKNNITNNAVGDGDMLIMNVAIPQKIKCADFMKAVFKAFNIYVQPDRDNDKKLYMETRDVFYANGKTIDITSKLDADEKIQITPMGELQAKTYDFKYADDKATYGEDHRKKYGIGYGDFKYNVDNDFLPENSQVIDLLFTSTVLAEVVPGANSGRVIGVTNTDQLRLLYFNTSSTVNVNPNNTWTHSGLTGSFSRRIFPYAGHLDKVEAPNYDLNWWYPRGVYFDYDSWTSNNLFNQGYKQQIEEITDKDSRLVHANIRWTAKDIFNFDYRDTFILDGHFLRLNKAVDYLVGKNITTPTEFLKIERKDPYVPPALNQMLEDEGDSVYTQSQRMLNGGGPGVKALLENGSNISLSVKLQGEGNIINEGSRIINVNGDNNIVGAYCENIFIQGDGNVVDPGLSNVSLVNTSNQTITESDVTYVNGVQIVNADATEDIITLYSDTTLDRTYHLKTVVLDATDGNMTITYDSANMEGVRIYFKRYDGTGNTVTFTDLDLTTRIDGALVPVVLMPNAYDQNILTSRLNEIFTLSQL